MNFIKRLFKRNEQKDPLTLAKEHYLKVANSNRHWPEVRFHGGCHGCTIQKTEGIHKCLGCKYHSGIWSLPNLNDYTKKLEEAKYNLDNVIQNHENI